MAAETPAEVRAQQTLVAEIEKEATAGPSQTEFAQEAGAVETPVAAVAGRAEAQQTAP